MPTPPDQLDADECNVLDEILIEDAHLNAGYQLREALRHALDVVATIVPGWLQSHARAEWLERYTGRSDEWRLPKSKEDQTDLANTIGKDGTVLFRQSIHHGPHAG